MTVSEHDLLSLLGDDKSKIHLLSYLFLLKKMRRHIAFKTNINTPIECITNRKQMQENIFHKCTQKYKYKNTFFHDKDYAKCVCTTMHRSLHLLKILKYTSRLSSNRSQSMKRDL